MAITLDSPRQRLFAFAVFYVIEGIPCGFTETFLPTHFGKANVPPTKVGRFGFWDSQPWAFKWLLAPIVDIVFSRRWWLYLTQSLMILSLLALFAFPDLNGSFDQITFAVFIHNVFSASHDLAVDSIAVGSLPLAEGSATNGAMFGAQEFGNALGGSVALWLSDVLDNYNAGIGCVLVLLILAFFFFTCRLDATVGAPSHGQAGPDASFATQLRRYFASLHAALLGPDSARLWIALVYASFPSGAALLRGPHCKTWMVAQGLGEADVASIEFAGKMCSIGTMLAGGFLGSKVSPQKLIAASYSGTVLIEALLAIGILGSTLSYKQWMSVKVFYNFSLGFHIGPQMAIFQSLCDERIAATLFTVFCCLCNNADSWAKDFHGRWIEKDGYESTAAWDAAVVLIPITLIALVQPGREHID